LRPDMKFVPMKTAEQQAILALHSARSLLVKQQTWVRGLEADSRNLAEISMIYEGQIRGVCLSRSGSRGRLFDGKDLLRY
jgi:hypothetical protein